VISPLYRGSVKDLLGPAVAQQTSAVVFEYSDAFSVFDWGRMPDLLPGKGQALAILAADIFEKLEKPDTWKEFSRSPVALALRKSNRFGGIFNELGEELQSEGLRTHYLGVLDSAPAGALVQPKKLAQVHEPFRRLVVRQVSVIKPTLTSVLGRTLPDYYPTRSASLPKLVPLEVVFRFSCPEGSSLLKRVEKDAGYLASLGFSGRLFPGVTWDFPVLEVFTKLEATDRPLALSEALAISGLSATQLQEVLLKTAWVGGLLRFWFLKLGIELCDGKLEWGLGEDGKSFLVDAIGPDELRLMKNGIQLSKEFLRTHFRGTPWYVAVEKAKAQAKSQGTVEWKRMVHESVPVLSAAHREVASQVYLALTHEMTGRKWFGDAAWDLQKVLAELRRLKKGLDS